MNPLVHREVQEVVSTLFRRHPALCGFSLEQDLRLEHLSCHPSVSGEEAQILRDEIAGALQELLEEQPEAAQVLPGRTFARSFH